MRQIPVGPLGLIPLKSCEDLGKKVDAWLVEWRKERESEHKTTIALLDTRKIPILSQDYYTPKGKQLTLADRRVIERWLREGLSHREVARRLAKAPQTINNEVKRGQVSQQVRKGKFERVYSADFAQKSMKTTVSALLRNTP